MNEWTTLASFKTIVAAELESYFGPGKHVEFMAQVINEHYLEFTAQIEAVAAQRQTHCPSCNHRWETHDFSTMTSHCIGNRNLCACTGRLPGSPTSPEPPQADAAIGGELSGTDEGEPGNFERVLDRELSLIAKGASYVVLYRILVTAHEADMAANEHRIGSTGPLGPTLKEVL